MARVIAGRAGSIPLDVPDAGTRPTSDRVRESLFGALESADALRGAAVLDLYAGSGALGLEAISRGAASADLVERAPRAVTVIERNVRRVVDAVGSDARVSVHRATVSAFLSRTSARFDLVFLDPPYDLAEAELTGALTAVAPTLTPGGIVVVERAARSPRPEVHGTGLAPDRNRRYGDTALWWLRREPPKDDQPRAVSQSR